MVFRERDEVVAEGLGREEDRKISGSIDRSLAVPDVAATDAVLGAKVPVYACSQGIEVAERRSGDKIVAKGDLRRGSWIGLIDCGVSDSEILTTGCLVAAGKVSRGVNLRGGGGHVLEVLRQVSGAESIGWQGVERSETGSSGSAEVIGGRALADGVALVVHEEEELVLEDRTANLAAVAVVIIARGWDLAACDSCGCIQIAVLEVLVS